MILISIISNVQIMLFNNNANEFRKIVIKRRYHLFFSKRKRKRREKLYSFLNQRFDI